MAVKGNKPKGVDVYGKMIKAGKELVPGGKRRKPPMPSPVKMKSGRGRKGMY